MKFIKGVVKANKSKMKKSSEKNKNRNSNRNNTYVTVRKQNKINKLKI